MLKYLISAIALLGLVACSEPRFDYETAVLASVELEQGCSGTLISETEILTAAHCVNGGEQKVSRVHVADSWFTAYTIKFDKEKDLAILTVPGVHFSGFAKVANKQGKIGDEIFMLGNPRSQYPDTLSKGIFSSFDRKDQGFWKVLNQMDLYGAPGNSGSGVLNSKGEIVGVLVSGQIDGFGGSITFAVTLKDIKEFLKDVA